MSTLTDHKPARFNRSLNMIFVAQSLNQYLYSRQATVISVRLLVSSGNTTDRIHRSSHSGLNVSILEHAYSSSLTRHDPQ